MDIYYFINFCVRIKVIGKLIVWYIMIRVVNKHLERGKALNAIAHSCAGLVGIASNEVKEKMSFIDFANQDGSIHKSISRFILNYIKGKTVK